MLCLTSASGLYVLSFYIQEYPLNPKALSLGELYGEFDLSTSEWTDGVLSSVMRQTCAGRLTLIPSYYNNKKKTKNKTINNNAEKNIITQQTYPQTRSGFSF